MYVKVYQLQRKPVSKNPKIKNLLASSFVIYTLYKQEPIWPRKWKQVHILVMQSWVRILFAKISSFGGVD